MKYENAGLHAMRSNVYTRFHKLVLIRRIEKDIVLNRRTSCYKKITISLVLSWASTIQKIQGKTFQKIVVVLIHESSRDSIRDKAMFH